MFLVACTREMVRDIQRLRLTAQVTHSWFTGSASAAGLIVSSHERSPRPQRDLQPGSAVRPVDPAAAASGARPVRRGRRGHPGRLLARTTPTATATASTATSDVRDGQPPAARRPRRSRSPATRRPGDPRGDGRPVPGRRLERAERPDPERHRPQRHPLELRLGLGRRRGACRSPST